MDLTRGIPLTPAGLADVPDFRLGETSVCPATRIVSGPGGDKQIEPRVMQVLIALADAQGGVVTRDALLDRCWGGVFVGDDSLNRAIAGIRRVAAGVAGGSFEIETISRTGYRLTVRQAHEIASPTKSRRTMLMGMAAAGSVGAGIAAFYSRGTPAPSASPIAASARQLYRNGLDLRSQGDVEAIGQVEAFFAKAVQTDPQFGEAWAALALARALQVPWEQDATQATIAAQAIFAANRALQIEPDLIEAQAAAALLPSSFRRWADAEASFRRLLGADQKTTYAEWVLRARLALTLGEVGHARRPCKSFVTPCLSIRTIPTPVSASRRHCGTLDMAMKRKWRAIGRWSVFLGIRMSGSREWRCSHFPVARKRRSLSAKIALNCLSEKPEKV